MRNLKTLIKIWIIVKILTLDLAVCVFGAEVSPVYNTQKPEITGENTAEIAGYIDITYATGGVDWKSLKAKFKNVWNVDFEVVGRGADIYGFTYDRVTEKVRAYNLADGSEVSALTSITNCYFIAKGQK